MLVKDLESYSKVCVYIFDLLIYSSVIFASSNERKYKALKT